jgi:hypothetical protein
MTATVTRLRPRRPTRAELDAAAAERAEKDAKYQKVKRRAEKLLGRDAVRAACASAKLMDPKPDMTEHLEQLLADHAPTPPVDAPHPPTSLALVPTSATAQASSGDARTTTRAFWQRRSTADGPQAPSPPGPPTPSPPPQASAGLLTHLTHLAESSGLLWLGKHGAAGLLSVMTGTLEGISHGLGAAGGWTMIGAECMVGYGIARFWSAGKYGTAALLIVVAVTLAAGDGWIASHRADITQRDTKRQDIEAGEAKAVSAGTQVNLAKACPVETQPASVVGYKQIDAWWAQANVRHQQCLNALAAQQQGARGAIESGRNALVELDAKVDDWERHVPVLVAIAGSILTAGGAAVAGLWVRSLLLSVACLLAIPGRLLGALTSRRP